MESLKCDDVTCHNAQHLHAIEEVCKTLIDICLQAGEAAFKLKKNKHCKSLPFWHEKVKPFRDKSLFWHQLWRDIGKPKHGEEADVMRFTRARYRLAIKDLKRNEKILRRERFAESVGTFPVGSTLQKVCGTVLEPVVFGMLGVYREPGLGSRGSLDKSVR